MMPFRAPPAAALRSQALPFQLLGSPPASWRTAPGPWRSTPACADAVRVADVTETREDPKSEKPARLASGVQGLDMYTMRAPPARAGLKYID